MAATYETGHILPSQQLEDTVIASWAIEARMRATMAGTGVRPRAPLAALEEDVKESVRTVERAVENLNALTDNCAYFKSIADDLREGLEAEAEHRKSALRQLAELEHGVRAERERAMRAEERAAASDAAVSSLQHEIDAVRNQTCRLVDVVSQLMPADQASELHAAFDRLVA